MGDLGLQGAYGLQGFTGGLEDAYAQRMQAAIAQNNESFRQKQLAQQDALTRLKVQELRDAATERMQAQKETLAQRASLEAEKNYAAITPTTPISPEDMQRDYVAHGISKTRFAPVPVGAPTPMTTPAPPASLAADPTAGPTPMPGTDQNSPQRGRASFHRIQTPAETDQSRMDAEQAAILADPNTPSAQKQYLRLRHAIPKGENAPYQVITEPNGPPGSDSVHDTTSGLMRIPTRGGGAATPVPGPNGKVLQGNHPPAVIAVHTVDENGNPITKIVPKAAGGSFAAAPNATTATRLASAKAVNQVGNDIIASLSDPATAATVGPALGRASTLRDFIGNPPPEFSHLAGEIESYSLANMGVHGMRSVQGAQMIQKLLDQHHTPESLIAAIQGLNTFAGHFIENETGRATQSSTGSKPPSGSKKKTINVGGVEVSVSD